MNRLHNLDYLRGVAALGIMLYHYSSWTLGNWSSADFMGRVGVYGVSIFYILSGLTMGYVYLNKLELSPNGLFAFFKKRFLRIYPLLWLASIATIVLSMKIPPTSKVLLNFTGFFGLIDWDNYIATGAWSIGNELVFYLFLPVFIFTLRKSKTLFWGVSLLITYIFLHFSFIHISADSMLKHEWNNYVNPLNQVFFFLLGFIVSWLLKSFPFSRLFSIGFIIFGLLLFIFYPVTGDLIKLITEIPRLVFTLSCLLICIGFFKLEINAIAVIHKPLSLLGEGSYSLYLLHPIVYNFMFLLNKHLLHFSSAFIVSVSIVLTFCLSYVVYMYFEKYFMRLAKSSAVSNNK